MNECYNTIFNIKNNMNEIIYNEYKNIIYYCSYIFYFVIFYY